MADWYFRNANSGLRTCPGCGKLVGTSEEFCPYCAKRLRSESGIRGAWKKLLAKRFIATRVILGALIAVFLLQIVLDMLLPAQYRLEVRGGGGLFSLLSPNFITFIRMGSSFHPLVHRLDEYWRLLTYAFLHAGIIHILFNGYALWTLGRLVESMWGARQTFATFILTGITGGLASYLWNFGGVVNSVGASGAICGLLGLLLGAYYKNRYHVGEFLGKQLIQWAVYLLVFGLVAGADNGAHIGGILGGAILGYFLPPTSRTRTLARDTKIWNAAAALSAALLVICAGFAVNFYLMGPAVVYNAVAR